MEFNHLDKAKITLLNLGKDTIPENFSNISSIVGDATNLREYDDNQYDLVFSNSVIEHVGGFEAQRRMAKEMMRVGKHCYLQTPNRYFPLEPHFLVPFFQFFPVRLKAFLIRRRQIGNIAKAASNAEALEIAESIRLLNKRELKMLFPEAQIQKEKLGFLTKSFYLYF